MFISSIMMISCGSRSDWEATSKQEETSKNSSDDSWQMISLSSDAVSTSFSADPLNITDELEGLIVTHQQAFLFGFSPNQYTVIINQMDKISDIVCGCNACFQMREGCIPI